MGCKYCDQYPNARLKDYTGNRAVSPRRSKLRAFVLSHCTCGDLQVEVNYQQNKKKDIKK